MTVTIKFSDGIGHQPLGPCGAEDIEIVAPFTIITPRVAAFAGGFVQVESLVCEAAEDFDEV